MMISGAETRLHAPKLLTGGQMGARTCLFAPELCSISPTRGNNNRRWPITHPAPILRTGTGDKNHSRKLIVHPKHLSPARDSGNNTASRPRLYRRKDQSIENNSLNLPAVHRRMVMVYKKRSESSAVHQRGALVYKK